MSEHATALFSAALERELDSDKRDHFEGHLAVCRDCRREFAEYRAGISALREMPRARMPVAIHLPSQAPASQRSGVARLGEIPRRWIAAASAAVAAVAVVATVALTGLTGAHTTATVVPQAAPDSVSNGAGAPGAAASPICSATPLSTQEKVAVPNGYAYSISRTDPSRPSETLLLATQSRDVTAGSVVTVYARLESPNFVDPSFASHASDASAIESLPCVSVTTSSGGANASTVPAPGPMIDTAPGGAPLPQPSLEVSPTGEPLFTVKVPAGAVTGTTITVQASVPANYPNSGNPPISAELTLQVG